MRINSTRGQLRIKGGPARPHQCASELHPTPKAPAVDQRARIAQPPRFRRRLEHRLYSSAVPDAPRSLVRQFLMIPRCTASEFLGTAPKFVNVPGGANWARVWRPQLLGPIRPRPLLT